MNTAYVLYNPYAANGTCKKDVDKLSETYSDAVFIDMRKISNYRTFISDICDSDRLIICGGDGTLNRFVNDIAGIPLPCKIYYYPVGSGNDFARDLGKDRGSAPDFAINDYIVSLPSVTVNGKKYLFVNGIGYGIDGYCCEEADKLCSENKLHGKEKPINYTSIAIKGLLFHYKPTDVTINVDGKEYFFRKVWLAPVMNGRYYGGGMMPTPDQHRISDHKKVSLMVMHGTGKLRTLMIFPSLFSGKHVLHKKSVSILSGNEITVTMNRPTPLQIDGETISDVLTMSVSACPSCAVAEAQPKETMAV